jgi:hypothetical protein
MNGNKQLLKNHQPFIHHTSVGITQFSYIIDVNNSEPFKGCKRVDKEVLAIYEGD